jgi:hypothetical protein
MSSSAKRLTIESMSVLTNESHAESFAEVGLKHWIGSDIMIEFTTLGRTKQVESARALVGEPPAWIEIDVLSALDLLDNVPEFHNHATRSGIDPNATLMLWTSKQEALDAFGTAHPSADEAAVSQPEAEPAEPESSDEEAPAATVPVEKPANATVPRPKPAAPVVAAPPVPTGTSPRLRRSSPFTGRTMMTPKAASSFVEAITDAGLDGLLDALQRAGITSLISLKKHDIADLTASLRRPHVKLGSTYTLSRVDEKSFLELGVLPSAAEAGTAGVVASGDEDVFSLAASTLGAVASVPPLFSLVAKPAPPAAAAPARKAAMSSAPTPILVPAVPRPPIPSAMPVPATTLISPSALAITEAIKTCPRALALLQNVPKSELVLSQLWTIAHAIDYETACSFENMDKSEDSAVDAIRCRRRGLGRDRRLGEVLELLLRARERLEGEGVAALVVQPPGLDGLDERLRFGVRPHVLLRAQLLLDSPDDGRAHLPRYRRYLH